MTAVLAPLIYQLGAWGLLVVLALVFAESGILAGFFLPGDSILFLTGALVASHVMALPLWLVLVATGVAAVLGDQLGYAVGRRFGPPLFSREESRFFHPRHAEQAREFFERRGGWAVVLARFLPVVRTFVPAVAGTAAMPRARFTTFNVLGAVSWACSIVLAGYFFGAIPVVAAHIELVTVGLASLSVVPLAVGLLRRRRRRSAATSSPERRAEEPVAVLADR